MPRKPRLHYPGALYHVISRGNNRQAIFLSEGDYRSFLEDLGVIKGKKPFTLFAYCLMPNHFHLLLEVADEPLSGIMQSLLTRYTLYFHRRHDRGGHLFQGRYKAILCDKESHFLELVRYIHLNPVRAGLAKSAEGWKWSGHGALARGTADALVSVDRVLEVFSPEKAGAGRRYLGFVREGIRQGHRADFYPKDQIPYLGSGKFVDENRRKHQTPAAPVLAPPPSSGLVGLLKEFCLQKKEQDSDVRGESRDRRISAVRKEFILEARSRGHRLLDIARFLRRTPAYIQKVCK